MALVSSQRASGSSSQQRLNGQHGADAAAAAASASSSSSSFSFLAAIQPLHDRFTFSYPLWQLRVDESVFKAAKRRLGIGTDGQHGEMVAMMLSAVLSNSTQQPLVAHQQPLSLSAPLALQLTLLVHQLRITSSWALQPLLRQPRAASAAAAAASASARSDGRDARRRQSSAMSVEDSLPFPDCDFLDEPPPRQLRQAASSSSSQSSSSSPSSSDDQLLYQTETGLFLHHLLSAFVSTASSSPSSSSSSSSSSSASSSPSSASAADAARLEAEVRALEAKLAASEEEVERMKAVMGEAAAVAGGRRGPAADGGAAARRKEAVRKMSDRSLLNPNIKRRRQRGIRLGD